MTRTRMRPAGVAMLLTAMVAVPLTAAAAPYVGPSSLGSPTIHTLPAPRNAGGTIIGIADNGYVATTFAVWPGIGYPTPPAFPNPTVTGSQYSIADINNLGVVAGTYRSVSGFDRGFVWTPGGTFIDVGIPAGSLGSFVRVTGIDDQGRIVGNFAATSGVCSSGGATCGFFGEPEGDDTYTLVPIGPEGRQFLPQDIGGGLVVGPGWTWDVAQDLWTPLADPAGGTVASGSSVNESRQISGHWIPFSGTTEALFWAGPDGAPTQLGTLPGDTLSQSNGIGEDGTVAGWSATASVGARRGWIWKDGTLRELGHVPGGTTTSDAFDVQGDLVVGTASGRAVFWDFGGTLDIDYPPEIELPTSISVTAGELVTISPVISDYEGDPFTVNCPSLPDDAACDADGNVTWQTDLTDASTTPYAVTITATQDDEPRNMHSVTIFVMVRTGVLLDPIGDKQVEAGSELRFTATSTGDTRVSYSYTPLLSGATFNLGTGEFVWTPTIDQVGQHVITVTVNGFNTSTTDSETLTITVTDPGAPPPHPISITVNESIGVGDSVTVQGPVVITVTEVIGVGDAVGVLPPLVIQIREAVGVSDTVAVRPPVMITVNETVGVRDGVSVRPPVTITVNETVGVSETVTIGGNAPVIIAITEVVGVADTTAVGPPVVISVFERIGAVDRVTVDADRAVTVESILDFVTTLDDDDFRLGSGARRALERLIAAAGGSLDALDSALARVDGCGDSADRNDLIVNCDAQHEVRRLLMLLREQMTNEN